MFLSVFDLFKVGVGPSSSHTMGPMVAGARFLDTLRAAPFRVHGLRASLHGSLAFTGKGHATDRATILGLAGFTPDDMDRDRADEVLADNARSRTLTVEGLGTLRFDPAADLIFDFDRVLPGHANGMVLMATDAQGDVIARETYYSVGGGFVVDESAVGEDRVVLDETPVRFPFASGVELLAICAREGLRVSDVVLANELVHRTEDEVRRELMAIWQVMQECVERGSRTTGVLPGGLKVRSRAADLRARLEVPPSISADELEAQAMADPAVVRSLEGKTVRKVIVRQPSLVNIVAG